MRGTVRTVCISRSGSYEYHRLVLRDVCLSVKGNSSFEPCACGIFVGPRSHPTFLSSLATHLCSVALPLTLPNLSCTSSGAALILKPFSVRPISDANVLCGFHFPLLIGVGSSIILSTCSRDSPFISGTKKKTKATQRMQREPQRKKTLAPRLASPGPVPTRYGVMTAII